MKRYWVPIRAALEISALVVIMVFAITIAVLIEYWWVWLIIAVVVCS